MSRARDDASPFHDGERAVQAQQGVRARAERVGQAGIRDAMPEQHREFFAMLPFVLVGSLDAAGRPWASVLVGAPGFLHSPDPGSLDIVAAPLPHDPLARAIVPGAALGMLGIQLETRRRNRMNGRIRAVSEHGFSVRVDQSFGNCPKYIQTRTPSPHALAPTAPTREGSRLSAHARALISRADTCFVASASGAEPALADPREGVDVSHRGGRPGFVRVDDQTRASVLTMPDFAGNDMFNTLGNLLRHPRAGLLFADFDSGDLLQLTCTTELVLTGTELESFAGARRLLRFVVEEGPLYPHAWPFAWSAPELSPQLVHTGSWSPRPLDAGEEP